MKRFFVLFIFFLFVSCYDGLSISPKLFSGAERITRTLLDNIKDGIGNDSYHDALNNDSPDAGMLFEIEYPDGVYMPDFVTQPQSCSFSVQYIYMDQGVVPPKERNEKVVFLGTVVVPDPNDARKIQCIASLSEMNDRRNHLINLSHDLVGEPTKSIDIF